MEFDKWAENKILDAIKKREFILSKDTSEIELNALRSLENNEKVYELEKGEYRVVPGKTPNKTINTAANHIIADEKSKEHLTYFTYDNITSKIKNNKFGATILLSVVGLIGITTLINELSDAIENIPKFNYFNAEVKSIDTIQKPIINVQPDFTNQILLDSLKLPYLKKVPILDKGIFIKYSYNNLVIGGVNIDSLNLNARTREGEPLPFRDYNQTLETNIKLQPYIELKYKGNYYSLEIVGSHSSFYCTMKESINPTLNLN